MNLSIQQAANISALNADPALRRVAQKQDSARLVREVDAYMTEFAPEVSKSVVETLDRFISKVDYPGVFSFDVWEEDRVFICVDMRPPGILQELPNRDLFLQQVDRVLHRSVGRLRDAHGVPVVATAKHVEPPNRIPRVGDPSDVGREVLSLRISGLSGVSGGVPILLDAFRALYQIVRGAERPLDRG